MNSTIKDILERRSSRKYLDKEVPMDLIEEIVTVGTFAPTGKNKQAPVIVAVTNKALRDRLSRINAEILGLSIDPFYGAPVVLVVLARKSVRTYVYDGSLVMGNMMLAASALGLGSCWIHRAKETFETEEGKQILADIGLSSDEYEGIGNCILGYTAPDGIRPQTPRKDDYVIWVK